MACRNVAFAADEARKVGIEVLVEAVNTFENGPYLLSTTEQAAGFARSVGLENVKYSTTSTTCSGWRGTSSRRSNGTRA